MKGFNVHTIALQIPKTELTKDGSAGTNAKNTNSIIGVYSTTTRPRVKALSPTGGASSLSSERVQVSRLGMPLATSGDPLGKEPLERIGTGRRRSFSRLRAEPGTAS